MADGGGLTTPVQLTADLAARAIVAAAASYGDDVVTFVGEYIRGVRKYAPRCLIAAAAGLDVAGLSRAQAARVLRIGANSVANSRRRADRAFDAAELAAAAAIEHHVQSAPAAIAAPTVTPRPMTGAMRILSSGAVRREVRELLSTDNATAPEIAAALRLGEAAVRQALGELAEAGEAKSDPLTAEGWRVQTWRMAVRA